MSTVTVKMCDVYKCGKEASKTIDTMLVTRQENGDGAFMIFTEKDVDLCGEHEYEYRFSLPQTVIKRREA